MRVLENKQCTLHEWKICIVFFNKYIIFTRNRLGEFWGGKEKNSLWIEFCGVDGSQWEREKEVDVQKIFWPPSH